MNRFKSIFSVSEPTKLYVVSGNHDIGFHYGRVLSLTSLHCFYMVYIFVPIVITPFLHERFVHSMDAPSVRRVTIRNNHFILLNSMALEGDGCFLCRPTELALNKMKSKFFQFFFNKKVIFLNFLGYLNCALINKTKDICHDNPFKRYSRPILLQVCYVCMFFFFFFCKYSFIFFSIFQCFENQTRCAMN